MTDPDPAGALASSPRQQEEEERATRVAPLTAGVDGQDLPRRSQPGEVTPAWLPMLVNVYLKRELCAYLDGLAITGDNIGDIRRSLFMPWDSAWNGIVREETASRESRSPMIDEEAVPHAFQSRTAAYEPGDDRDIWCRDCEYHRDHVIHAADSLQPPPERPPARSLAVDPADGIVAPRQRAAETSSDPDLGAALGRLPLDLDVYPAVEDALAKHCRGWVYKPTTRENIAELVDAVCETYEREVQKRQDAEKDVAQLRHLAHQLRQALIAAQQFLKPDVDRGPQSNGWCNTVELVNAALTEPPA